MKSLIEELFSLDVYKDETTRTVAKYVLAILYIAVALGFATVIFSYFLGNWANSFIAALITIVCAYSLVLLRSGRLNESVLVPAFFTISGVMMSVTFGAGLSDPGILLLFPLLAALTIFLNRYFLSIIGGVLFMWIILLAFLTSIGYYDGRADSMGPYAMASVIGVILVFSLALYRLTYKQVLVINKDLESARQAAEDANHAKSSFLATMSHELRTPLNAVIGYSDAIIEEVMEDGFFIDDHVEDLERIKRSGHDLLRMINGILDLSKIEENKMSVEKSVFSVVEICQESLSVVKPMAHKNLNRLKLTNNLSSNTIYLNTDQTKLRQILINLLSNAAKCTQNGSIELELFDSPLEPNKLQFNVIDTGVGIPQDKLQLIFEAFQQVDGSLSRSFSGTGLGLAISRKLTKLLDGELTVQSEVGVGSTFTLKVPYEQSQQNLIPEQLNVEYGYEFTG